MKNLTLVLLACLLTVLPAKGQSRNTGYKNVNQTIIDLFQGFSDLDLEKIKSHCTPDFLLFENGAVWNADSLAPGINRRKSAADFMRINKFEFLKTEIRGSTAWTSYYNQAEITSAGKSFRVRWLESAILVKEGRKWRIRFLHSTQVERTNL